MASHSAEEVINRLREGNSRFVLGTSGGGFSKEKRARLSNGQCPWAAVAGCSDSRVPVEVIFDAEPGDLFVVRTAGHVLASVCLASLRFAVEQLHVSTVIVLGHEQCGAVNAVLANKTPEWFLPVAQHIRVEGLTPGNAVCSHVDATVSELQSFFSNNIPASAPPTVIGAVFSFDSGQVHFRV